MYIPQGLIELETPKVHKRKAKKSSNDMVYNDKTLIKEHIVKYTNYPNNLLYFNKESKTVHPTQKPIDLLEYLIKTYTREGNIILDNCIGSGSTGVAALNLNRRFIGIELDKNYFNIAKNRIEHIILD